MIAAKRNAVDCIRDGLVEASFVTPFMEPYLPFYDALRDTPEFIELISVIDGVQPAGDARAGSGGPWLVDLQKQTGSSPWPGTPLVTRPFTVNLDWISSDRDPDTSRPLPRLQSLRGRTRKLEQN